MNKTEKRNNKRFHIFRSTFKMPNSETFFNLNSTTKTLNTIVDKNELNKISLYITKNMKSNNLIGYQNRNMSIASASKNSFPIRNNKRMSNNWPKTLNRLNSFTSSSIQNKIKFNSSILKLQKPHNFPFMEKYVSILDSKKRKTERIHIQKIKDFTKSHLNRWRKNDFFNSFIDIKCNSYLLTRPATFNFEHSPSSSSFKRFHKRKISLNIPTPINLKPRRILRPRTTDYKSTKIFEV